MFLSLSCFAISFVASIFKFKTVSLKFRFPTSFPVLISIAQKGFTIEVFIIAASLVITQMVIGNVIEPKITGKSLNISPLVILISLILWGWMWGIVGMVLAVPITSALKIFFSHIPQLKPIADMISAE